MKAIPQLTKLAHVIASKAKHRAADAGTTAFSADQRIPWLGEEVGGEG